MNFSDMKLGIPTEYEMSCIKNRDNVSPSQEFFETSVFLRDFFDNSDFMKYRKNYDLKFINWGDTELVYALKNNEEMFALVVGQPTTPYGTVKKEYDNLKEFGKKNPQNIVTPIDYYFNDKLGKELFVAPYIYQARCISNVDGKWGMYVPEPEYHFQEFSKEESSKILPCIIARLVSLYDKENNIGIASCQTISGDFILDKKIDEEDFSITNILKYLKLISIRDTTSVSLQDYINIVKREFSNLPQNSNIINSKSEAIIRFS